MDDIREGEMGELTKMVVLAGVGLVCFADKMSENGSLLLFPIPPSSPPSSYQPWYTRVVLVLNLSGNRL